MPSNIGATVHFLVFTNSPLFTPATVNFQLDLKQLGLSGRHQVRNLWLRRDLGRVKKVSAEIPPHGCLLLKVVLVAVNNQWGPKNLAVKVGDRSLDAQLPPKSFNTLIFPRL